MKVGNLSQNLVLLGQIKQTLPLMIQQCLKEQLLEYTQTEPPLISDLHPTQHPEQEQEPE